MSALFAPVGATVITADDDGEVMFWDIADPFDPVHVATAHHGAQIRAIALSPRNETLVTTGADQQMRLWMLPPE